MRVFFFQAVMDARNECDNSDSDNDNTPAAMSKATRTESLQATFVIQDYLKDIDDPFARKFGPVLMSFGCQTHLTEFQNLTTTAITDYFARNSS